MSRTTLEFENLPLVEVAVKHVLRHPLPVNLPFILELRDKVREHFPQVLDLVGLESPPGHVAPVQYDVHTAAGCRLVQATEGITVVVQRDMIVARWTRQDKATYPRFPALQSAIQFVETAIASFLPEPPEVSLLNVAYANRLGALRGDGKPCPSPWPLSDRWTIGELRERGQVFQVEASYRTNDTVDRRYLLQARSDQEGGEPWFLFLTVAGSTVEKGEPLRAIEMKVHDSLIDWFPELLSTSAKQQFGLKQ